MPKQIEIDVMSKKPASERYVYSIKRIADREMAFSMADEGGIVALGDDAGNTLFALWPFEEVAKQCIKDEWSACVVHKIPLDELISEILPNLIKQNHKISIFITPDGKETPVVNAVEFLKDLQSECSKYD